MATVSAPTVIAKLDKMRDLLAEPERWIQGSNRRILLVIDKKTRRPMMAYCLRGAAIAAGNGAQLYWELAWTIDKDELLAAWKKSTHWQSPESMADDRVVNFNDAKETEYKMIKSVIARTRARISRYGLLKLPRRSKAA